MSIGTNIEWTDATWSPLLGCSPTSAGCANCYAVRDTWRLAHNPNRAIREAREGLVEKTSASVLRWTGTVHLLPELLDEPLHWKKPRRIFVANQADLFHEDVPNHFIRQVFEVMAKAPQHTFQVLTKRADRLASFLPMLEFLVRPWPLPNVWLGVSVENQDAADERIPHLLDTPAAVRFLSCEPLLGPVDLSRWITPRSPWALRKPGTWADVDWPAWVPQKVRDEVEEFWGPDMGRNPVQWLANADEPYNHAPAFGELVTLPGAASDRVTHTGRYVHAWNNIGRVVTEDGARECVATLGYKRPTALDWVIVGGESGPDARPCDVAWIRSIVEQCRRAGVPTFVKQLGAHIVASGPAVGGWPIDTAPGLSSDTTVTPTRIRIRDRKGGTPEEWPEDLRVRQTPRCHGFTWREGEIDFQGEPTP